MLCMCRRSCARVNDAKIMRSRDMQCNTSSNDLNYNRRSCLSLPLSDYCIKKGPANKESYC